MLDFLKLEAASYKQFWVLENSTPDKPLCGDGIWMKEEETSEP